MNLYGFVKPVPSVLTANTVPLPELPPLYAVPYRVLPDKLVINPAYGLAPSLPVNLCMVVKVCAVTRPASITPRSAISAVRGNLVHGFACYLLVLSLARRPHDGGR